METILNKALQSSHLQCATAAVCSCFFLLTFLVWFFLSFRQMSLDFLRLELVQCVVFNCSKQKRNKNSSKLSELAGRGRTMHDLILNIDNKEVLNEVCHLLRNPLAASETNSLLLFADTSSFRRLANRFVATEKCVEIES